MAELHTAVTHIFKNVTLFKYMSQLAFFGFEVFLVVRVTAGIVGHPRDDFNPQVL